MFQIIAEGDNLTIINVLNDTWKLLEILLKLLLGPDRYKFLWGKLLRSGFYDFLCDLMITNKQTFV